MNYRMIIQYDGTRYKGWQRQEGIPDTIQGKIEKVLSRWLQREIQIDGAGRTDAGVHALAQVANVHLTEHMDTEEIRNYLNEYLPEDIRILKVDVAGERFHSRLNATGKVYEYYLLKKDAVDVFGRKYCWQMKEQLNLAAMKQAIAFLLGQHDFRGFCTKASKKKSTIRRLNGIDIGEKDGKLVLRFEGDGFLYNMVRILTGTLVEVGTGKRTPESILSVLQSGERRLAGVTAPAQGLFLVSVKYE